MVETPSRTKERVERVSFVCGSEDFTQPHMM